VQLSWLNGWLPEPELALALRANPAVEWYLRHKCPETNAWLDRVMVKVDETAAADSPRVREAELAILRTINDLLVYAVDPAIYDAQPFLNWDSDELRLLADWPGKTVIDVGSGTGRLAFVAAQAGAHAVFAAEPVGNLRYYVKEKARRQGLRNVFPVDGTITDLPFPDGFADVTMGGHVFGDHPAEEHAELRLHATRGRWHHSSRAAAWSKQPTNSCWRRALPGAPSEEPCDRTKENIDNEMNRLNALLRALRVLRVFLSSAPQSATLLLTAVLPSPPVEASQLPRPRCLARAILPQRSPPLPGPPRPPPPTRPPPSSQPKCP
jgi:SAM-dependent methyltransferase